MQTNRTTVKDTSNDQIKQDGVRRKEGTDQKHSECDEQIRKGNGIVQANIEIMTFDLKIYRAIMQILSNSFTAKEIKIMAEGEGLTIEFDERMRDAGLYLPSKNKIILNPLKAGHGTTIHEAIHHLRRVDTDRKEVVSRTRLLSKRLNDEEKEIEIILEESATTAETFIRLDVEKDPAMNRITHGFRKTRE